MCKKPNISFKYWDERYEVLMWDVWNSGCPISGVINVARNNKLRENTPCVRLGIRQLGGFIG